MPQNNNYFKIGFFTIIGIGLFMAGLLAFGLMDSMFQERIECVTFFDRSVQGLSRDSSVQIRGFRVGRVTSVSLASLDNTSGQPGVKVIFEIDPRVLIGDTMGLEEEQARAYLVSQTEKGLRAVLSFQGITGISFLDLDFQDASSSRQSNYAEAMQKLAKARDMVYIPSGPGQIMEISESVTALVKSLSDIDFGGMAKDVAKMVDTFETAVANLNTGQLSSDMSEALVEVRAAASDFGLLVESLNGTIQGGASSSIAREVESSVQQLRQSLKRFDQILGSSQGNLPVTLDNLRVMSENFREMSELLRAQPSQVIFGGPPAESRPAAKGTPAAK